MHGNCLCGEVQFELSGKLPKIYQCHCSLCRKQSGTSSNAALIIAQANFRWLSGSEFISSYVKPTGFRSDFCSKCGSPVPNPLRSAPLLWVPAGLLESGENLEITVHLFTGSKTEWDIIPSNGVKYETAPELTELLELLHSHV